MKNNFVWYLVHNNLATFERPVVAKFASPMDATLCAEVFNKAVDEKQKRFHCYVVKHKSEYEKEMQ